MDASKAAQNALACVLDAKETDRLCILCDDTRSKIGEAFQKGAHNLKMHTKLVVLETGKTIRTEMPAALHDLIANEHADIYINLFRGNSEETPFRIKIIAAETGDHKTRLGHCPGVTMDMLTQGALAMTKAEHRRMQKFAANLMQRLADAASLDISTPAGTNLTLNVEERPFCTDTMVNWVSMQWMNLPTGEVFVAPVEDSLNGRLVCDLAVGGVGPLKKPVIIQAKNGTAEKVSCSDGEALEKVKAALATDAMSKVVGEFAFGINPKARLVDEFLEAEKVFGTCHIAFGHNTDMPNGKNTSANHMDFLMGKPTVKATLKNGKTLGLVADGVWQA
jgi:leucyl aminopeptidase (aminopeptidase T)